MKLFTEFRYAAGTWKYPRRMIAKAESNRLGPNNRFIVTNLDDDGQYLSEKVYCACGEMANRVKEQQLDLLADRTSCHDFVTNQFRLLLSSLAYILMERFRTLLLTGTEFAEATCGQHSVINRAIIRQNTRKIFKCLAKSGTLALDRCENHRLEITAWGAAQITEKMTTCDLEIKTIELLRHFSTIRTFHAIFRLKPILLT